MANGYSEKNANRSIQANMSDYAARCPLSQIETEAFFEAASHYSESEPPINSIHSIQPVAPKLA
jgi:hypothetical protein